MKPDPSIAFRIIRFALLSFFVFHGIVATFGDVQQMFSISMFLFISYWSLAFSTITDEPIGIRRGAFWSALMIMFMFSVSVDIPTSSLKTKGAIAALIIYICYQTLTYYKMCKIRRQGYIPS